MQALAYSSVRKDLAKTMDRICQDHDTVIVTRQNAGSVVMISLEEYESLTETQFLLRSSKNRERLISAVSSLRAGSGTERELSE